MERAMLPRKTAQLAIISGLLFTFLMLSACGGGGNSPEKAPPPASQMLSFTTSTPAKLIVGETLINKAQGQGSGLVSYASSDTNIAIVDNNGLITAKGAGSTTITASIAADSHYLAATATYSVNSIAATAEITAWIGEKDTKTNFPTELKGVEFYRSSAGDCNFANYLNCVDGQLDLLNGASITDTASTLSKSGYYLLNFGLKQARFTTDKNSTTAITVNSATPIASFKNQLWLISGAQKNEVYSSLNGIKWNLVTTLNRASTDDNKLELFVQNDQLMLLDWNNQLMWASADGLNWSQKNVDTSLFALIGTASLRNEILNRTGKTLWGKPNYGFFKTLVLNGKLINIATSISTTPDYPDCRSNSINTHGCLDRPVYIFTFDTKTSLSDDGTNWKATNTDLAISVFAATTHQNKIWLIGSNSDLKTLVLTSEDGVNWQQQTDNANLQIRTAGQLISYQDKLWMIDGFQLNSWSKKPTALVNEVWSSSDGINWTQEKALPDFAKRAAPQALLFKNELLLIGGLKQSAANTNVLDITHSDWPFDELQDVWLLDSELKWRKGYYATTEFH